MYLVGPEPQYDFSLRLLSLVVAGALIASLIALLTTIIRPQPVPDRGDVGPPSWAAVALPMIVDWEPLPLPLAPPVKLRIYRCDTPSEVIYSDRPCADGRGRILEVPAR